MSQYNFECQEEADYWNEPPPQEEEPNVVPCYLCGCQMYQIGEEQKDNICQTCEKAKQSSL